MNDPNGVPNLLVIAHSDGPGIELESLLLRGLKSTFEISRAATGIEGLSQVALSPKPACVVVTDPLADMSALEFLEALPIAPLGPQVPVVVVADSPDPDRRRELFRAGAQDYLIKPGLDGLRVAMAVENAMERQGWRALSHREEIRRREAALKSLADNVPDVVARFDPELRHVFVNAGLTRITGLLPEHLLGKTNRELGVPDHLCDKWDADTRLVFETGQPHRIEYFYPSPNGELRLEARIIPEFGPDGQVESALSLTRDVTATWQNAVELAQAKERAEAASAARDQFLAVLSHELRTPLAPVRLALSNWEQYQDQLPPEFRTDLAMIRRNIELECRLIDDLLDMNRVSAGKLELHTCRFDLQQELRHAMKTVEFEAQQSELSLSLEAVAAPSEVIGDPSRIQQVLWNLLRNAVKFTPPGGSITVRNHRTGNGRIRVEITDTGIGIDHDVITRIFNAFEQGGVRVTRQFGGLGLGLAISKAVVEAHGGSLTASSDGTGKGSTFALDLKLAEPLVAQAPPGELPAASPPPRERLRILLVEDHEDTAMLFQRMLRTFDYEVTTAASVAEALAAIETGPFDVIISDLGLPDGNGHEIMRRAKAEHPTVGIALSGYGMEEDIERSHAAGFAAHLIKPVLFEQILVTIRRVTAGG